MPKVSHEERTAADPRGPNLYSVIVHKIDQVNEKVRLIQLRKIRPEDAIKVRALKGCSVSLWLRSVTAV